MDGAKWWNTKGILGKHGSIVLGRGFPRTRPFVQAKIAFAVVTERCREIFAPPKCITLWDIPAVLEDQFDQHLRLWQEDVSPWMPLFNKLETLPSTDLLDNLKAFDLLDDAQVEEAKKLRRSAEGKSVMISGTFSPNDQLFTLLASGFFRGDPGNPVIPYAKLD